MSDTLIQLKDFQDKFIFSQRRFPAFVGGWGTGKDLCSITRGMEQSEKYKNNLGLIARLEATDLADSTIRDFRLYTGLPVDSHRDAKLYNGSEIMFRHLEELTENNLNNMNLGWFCLIQADEIDTDSIFLKLCGRLRRCHGCGVKPCVCYQTGFVSANTNAEDWICKLWGSSELGIKGTLEDAELIEAKTHDNADILSVAFIKSLEEIKRNRPEMYARFVDNSRLVGEEKFVVLPYQLVRECVDSNPVNLFNEKRRITVCDPSEGDVDYEEKENMGEGGGDETVIYDMENSRILKEEIYKHVSLTDTMARIIIHAKEHGSTLICVDKIGIGAKLYSDLYDVYKNDSIVKIYGFDSRVSAPQGYDETYANYKAYAWFQAREKWFNDCQCSIPNDHTLIRQLSKVRYKYTTGISGGKYMILQKDKLKRILGCSPDRADAFIMGLDALQYASPINKQMYSGSKSWVHPAYRVSNGGKYAGKALPEPEWRRLNG